MTNLLDRIKEIRSNLSLALREADGIDDLLDDIASQGENAPVEQLEEAARRLNAVADAKDGDWFTQTFTMSTAAEIRSLAGVYERLAAER